ncbi:MAG TPA: hypothetical protein VEE87_00345 [archaeon]|nr:hypothetical protein [archaeon]
MELDRNAFSEVFMIPLSSAVSGGLTWSKIPRTRSYELKLNGELVGKLERPSFWCSKFLAETHEGRWIFRRGGFLGTRAEIVDAASGQPVAKLKSSWSGGGTLSFADGQRFHLTCKGWWRPVWSVTRENGQPVLQLHTREKTIESAASVAVPGSRLSLLTLFAWYRVLQAEEDAASAAAVAVITAS